MKQGIHPNYVDCTITCACGNVIKTRSTKPEIHVEVCSKCHPFYTGKQKLVDSGGRVERFNKRFGRTYLHRLLVIQERRSPCGERRSFLRPGAENAETAPEKQYLETHTGLSYF